MPEYLRVKQTDTGHELSVTRSMYDFAPDAYEVLKGDAVGPDGEPLAPVYKETKKTAAPAQKES